MKSLSTVKNGLIALVVTSVLAVGNAHAQAAAVDVSEGISALAAVAVACIAIGSALLLTKGAIIAYPWVMRMLGLK